MNIFIYGDSNTFGQVPNIDGYQKNAEIKKYKQEKIWWNPLTKKHHVFVNALPGRAIANDSPWLSGRNAKLTIEEELKGVKADIVILQLGTNDCKSKYNLTPSEITNELNMLILKIRQKLNNAKFVVISPPIIREGNKITDKYYTGAEKKSRELDSCYFKLCEENNYIFISGAELEVGEDGEHLTEYGHHILSEKVFEIFEKGEDFYM